MQKDRSKISIQIISNPTSIKQMEQEWNALVSKTCKQPFYLSEYAKEYFEVSPTRGKPIILVFSKNRTILGAALLKTRMNIIGRYVEFIHPSWCSEFLFDEEYRDECIRQTFDFLFNKLKCKSATFNLPEDSPNLRLLTQQCKSHKIHSKITPITGNRIITLTSTWNEFQKSRTKNFRKRFARIERKLNEAGSWKTTHIEGKEGTGIIEKILEIERKSWKEKYWAQRKDSDWALDLWLKVPQLQTKSEPTFRWSVWFLTLNDKNIAYELAYEYKEVAYFLRTSYDEEYQVLSPGTFIINTAIHELFDKRQNNYIDFINDVPYLQTWSNKCIPRIRVTLTKGIIPTASKYIFENPRILKIMSLLF